MITRRELRASLGAFSVPAQKLSSSLQKSPRGLSPRAQSGGNADSALRGMLMESWKGTKKGGRVYHPFLTKEAKNGSLLSLTASTSS